MQGIPGSRNRLSKSPEVGEGYMVCSGVMRMGQHRVRGRNMVEICAGKMGDSKSIYLIELLGGLNEVVYLKYLAQSL